MNTVNDAETEVWRGECGVVKGLDHAVVHPHKGLNRVGGGLVEFENHIGAEEKHSVGKRSSAVINAENVLAVWEGAELFVDCLDEARNSR